jgi:hypothetical protein
MYMKLNTTGDPATGSGADGISRVWVDGRLVGEYTDVMYQDQTQDDWRWQEIKLENIWGGVTGPPIPEDQWTQYDHVYVSGR